MKKSRYLAISLITLISVSVIFFSFTFFQQQNNERNVLQKTKIFYQVIQHIMDDYVEDVDVERLINKAIEAMMEEIDPHSNYLPPQNFERMSEMFLGYEGIGVQFRMINEKPTVMHVLKDGPSERAGLQLGDRIIEADGTDLVGLGQNDIPPILKGPRGTRVKVMIERPGTDNPIPVTITRGRAIQESVRYYYMIDEITGYIKLDTFSRTTGREIQRAIKLLESRGMQKLVFDLRQNTGGLLSQAIEVADQFMKGGKVIVETRGRIPTANSVYKSSESPADFLNPMIVLVDENSASASEVVSGALQDMDRALIVGKTTFGKGLMQNQIQFEDRSALVLTTGRWYTPLGRLIQKDYDNKSREEYQRDARNDSLNVARDLNEDKPSFKTPTGRVVYGGGGIKPDVELDGTDFVNGDVYWVENFSPTQTIFLYAQEFSIANKNKWKNYSDFLENYKFNEAEQQKFIDYYNTANADAEGQVKELYSRALEHMDDLGIFLKARVAEFLWGDEARIRVFTKDDNVLNKSLKHFEQAGSLIKNR
ncbi:MAG: S41 family peptidase [bacterium]|nr:S41 family peptidase [bacterium]